ncbi:hypothetical protein E3N88_40554 [Mikania micrantha]|uniref:Chromo domain-containing protein n=1 Tax=Mikania micrantha TaxID=192012 RepID=A0A5N6LN22_9ASTR|nr:hypothetical protein E3N88_40554 [Mikania micrantha]
MAILAHRTINRANNSVSQVLVQWEGLNQAEATWEDLVSVQQSFPTFHLEDKVVFKEGGNVVNEDKDATGGSQVRRSKRAKRTPARLQGDLVFDRIPASSCIQRRK